MNYNCFFERTTSLKRILLLLVVAIFGMNLAYGQTPVDTVYMIGTPIGETGDNGILRGNNVKYRNNPLYKYPPIHVELRVKSKRVNISFGHYNYNPAELAKKRPVKPLDEMVIQTKPVEFLKTVNLMDLDVMFSAITSKKEFAEDFAKSLRGKTIFFIDRNDITATTVTLIQVKNDTPASF